MGPLRTSVDPRVSHSHPTVGQAANSPRSLDTSLLSEAPWVYVLICMYFTHIF